MSVVNPILQTKDYEEVDIPTGLLTELFNELKGVQSGDSYKYQHRAETYASTMDNLTAQAKLTLKTDPKKKANGDNEQTQEIFYTPLPTNMNTMIDPMQMLQNNIMQNQMVSQQINNLMMQQRLMAGGGMGFGPALSGAPASVQQAASLISARTVGFKGANPILPPQVKQEMAVLLQRMIAEGAARGVDVVAMIRRLPGGTLKLAIGDKSWSGIGVGGTSGSMFNPSYWNKYNFNQKLSIFFQEVSHQLGNMSDRDRGPLNTATNDWRGFMDGVKNVAPGTPNYNQMTDWLFEGLQKFSKVYVGTGARGAAPAGSLPGENGVGPSMAAAGASPYNDLLNGIAQGLQIGMQGAQPAGAAGLNPMAPQMPQITPPAPIPTLAPPAKSMQPLEGQHQPSVNQPGGLAGPTVDLDTVEGGSPQSFEGANGSMNADLAKSTQSFAFELGNIRSNVTSPLLQGLAGALLC